MPGGSLSSK